MKKALLLSLFFTLVACGDVTPAIPSSTVAPPQLFTATSALVVEAPAPVVDVIEEPTSSLGAGSVRNSEKDGAPLVYVPEGQFIMGTNDFNDAVLRHSVFLDAFWIDQFEVTNRQYALCVSAGECPLPTNLKSANGFNYFSESIYDNFPVVYVDWYMAETYCNWAGRRLPSEAEWEKAARGENGKQYPWGNEAPNNTLLNFNSLTGDTSEVGSYPNGASPYGALDMAGNVWEWVNDWYHSSYYQFAPTINPPGPDASDHKPNQVKSLRGGSWYFHKGSPRSIFRYGVIPVNDLVRSDLRSWLVPDYRDTSKYGKPPLGLGTIGFRCAMSLIP